MKKLSKMLLASCAIMPGTIANAKGEPNVLVFLVDDLGWKDISCAGSNYYETPNVDRIASDGVRFVNSYAACSVSSPSRASIQTGKFTARHGITDWIGDASGPAWRNWRNKKRHSKLLPATYKHNLGLGEYTIAECLRDNGYNTYHLGKWHLGKEGSLPEDHGYEFNVGGDGNGLRGDIYFAPYKNPKIPEGPDGENICMRLGWEASDIIKKHANMKKDKKPFFIMFNFFAVHSPNQCSKEKWQYFRDKAEKMGIKPAPGAFVVDRTLPVRQYQDNPVYAGLISHMDDAVGIVLDALAKYHLEDDTIVIFTSDNGGVSAGEQFATSNLPLRGGKGYQWEGGLRVPLIIRYPGCKKGSTSAQPVIGTDLYPTILDLAGLKSHPEQHLDGISVKPFMENTESAIVDRKMFWHYPHYGSHGGEPCSIIKDGDWKLIYYYEDFRTELYNMNLDQTEAGHLNALHPERAEAMKNELISWLKSVGAVLPVADEEYDPIGESKYRVENAQRSFKNASMSRQKMLSPDFKPRDKYCGPQDIWWGQRIKTEK